jgi:ribonuclease J
MNLFTSWLKDPKKPEQPAHQPKPQNPQPSPPKPQNPNPPKQHNPNPQNHPPRPPRPQGQHQHHNRNQPNQRQHFGQRNHGAPRRPFMASNVDANQPANNKPVPPLEQGKLRVITLGGLEEVGKNSIAFEYGDSAIIIDMGLQFPDENMHGIDYAVADYNYFRGKEKNIKGVIITHGHLDHIGGIPHVMPRLGLQIPMYCTPLTAALIQKRQEESKQHLNIQVIKPQDTIKIGPFTIDFFRVNHSIPDAVGVVIGTPVGNFVHTGDWKIDLNPINDEVFDFAKVTRIGERGVVAAFCDSTNAYQDGLQKSESAVKDPLDSIFFKAKQRIIVGTFASNLSRVQQLIGLSEQYGRKVVLLGRTMTNNVLIARNLKYMKVAPHTLITVQEANKLRPDQVTIILTGAQGEKNAALMRAALGEHRFVQIQKGDTVVFSSSIIPGNEQSVGQLMDRLYRLGAKAINYTMMEVHAGGHAKAQDTQILLRILKPKFFVPIEGNHYLLCKHAEIAARVGYTEHTTIIPDNGTVIDFDAQGNAHRLKEKAPHNLIAIDGLGMGDVSESVIAERHEMSENGIFVINVIVSKHKGELIGQPEITSKGFIYVRGAEALNNEAKAIVTDVMNQHGSRLYPNNVSELKGMIQSSVNQFLFKKTERQPMVLVSILGA